MLRYVCWWAMMVTLATGEMWPALAASSVKNSSARSERARVRKTPPTGSLAVTVMVVAQTDRGVPEVPTQFYLAQNYPNPFNATTVINYATPRTARVRLDIFNGLGQRVATLVDEVQPTGYYSYQWGTEAMASGVYLYRMTAGPFTQTRRMILVK